MSRTETSPSFSNTSNTRTKPNSNAASTSPFDKTPDSPHPLSARTFKNPRATWSMNPLKDALPGSPPPFCSGGSSPLSSSATLCTPISDSFYPDLPTTELSTPRNKGIISGFEVKEGMESSATGFGRFCQPKLLNNSPKGYCLSKLSMHETVFSDPNRTFDLGRESPSEREESSVYNEEYKHIVPSADQSSDEESDGRSLNFRTEKLMDRPKPYHEFLDEVKNQELKAEIKAWKKAEHMRLMTRLRKEEAAIDDWEFKQTSKALKEIKKLESKLEKERAKAVENTWKTISIAKEEANNKKIKVRRSTIGKISSVSETYQKASFSTKKFIWHKVTAYCKSMYLKSVRCTALPAEARRS
ncbi:unnamed protein product [Malus baccata var. baccata]